MTAQQATKPFQLSQIGSIVLGVSNLDQSLLFYTGKLGLKVRLREQQLAVLDTGNMSLVLSPGHMRLAPQAAGATEVVFQVEHVRAAKEALTTQGVSFFTEPRQVTPTDWAAHFRDPDGHLLSIFGPE
ncbi:MAG TPA: VOC family protein [Terriglobales bacterium]|nr:VOC family protein [Terriglobales bacterium]